MEYSSHSDCLVCCRELSIDELVDIALGTMMHKTLILRLIYIQYMWMMLLHLR